MNEVVGLKLNNPKESNKDKNKTQNSMNQIDDSIVNSVIHTNTEEVFQYQKNNNCFRIIQILLSEFGFIFLLLIIFFISYLIPQYHSPKIFTSKNNLEFTQDPIILIHTTDLHISVNKEERTDGSTLLMMSLCEYNPDLVLLTGDYVDNFKKNKNLGYQNLQEWEIYNSTIRSILSKKGIKVIEVSGNHDQWAVDKFDSKENNYLDNSFSFNRYNTKTKEDFFMKKVNVNINKTNLTFLLINDYRYPVYRPPYGLEKHLTKNQLDQIENGINSLEEKEIFILTHHPVDKAWLLKSNKGNSYDEIISNEKVYAIFTGHMHPREVKIVHHGSKGGLEFCAPSPFDNRKAGLITIDNGNLIYHEVHIPYFGKKPLFFLTYPTPNEQLSSHHFFNSKNFDIRVISYIPNENIKLKIEGDINGYLLYDHSLNNGALLYKYHVNNLKEGKYNIHIFDENGFGCNINTEFTIGNKYKGKKEKYFFPTRFLITYRFCIIPFFIFLLIIIFPFFPHLNLCIVKKLERNIEGKSPNNTLNPILKYLIIFLLSPFFLRLRLQTTLKIKPIIRYALFISLIYPLILPIHFMERINGKIGYNIFVFVVLDGKAYYEHCALNNLLIYYGTTLLSFVLFSSGKKFYNKSNQVYIIINCIIGILLISISLYFNFYVVAQSISLGYLFFSTAYILVFIALLILFIIFFF